MRVGFRERIERVADGSLADQLQRRAAHVAANVHLGSTVLGQRLNAMGELEAYVSTERPAARNGRLKYSLDNLVQHRRDLLEVLDGKYRVHKFSLLAVLLP